jgi:hypothetical protein
MADAGRAAELLVARVQALAAGEDPHGGRPAGELVTGWPLAHQPGSARPRGLLRSSSGGLRAAIGAGVISGAPAHLAAGLTAICQPSPGPG